MMIFTIKRASDSINKCTLWEKPCEKAQAIDVLAQDLQYKDHIEFGVCPEPVQMYIIELDTLDDLVSLIKDVGEIVVYESPYVATPGRTGDNAPWKESVRDLDGQPLEILNGAHGIIIYDDYME